MDSQSTGALQHPTVQLSDTHAYTPAPLLSGAPQFSFQVTRKDPSCPRSPHRYQQLDQLQQLQRSQQRPHNRPRSSSEEKVKAHHDDDAGAAMADMAHVLPYALLLIIGWACLVTGALQMLALPPEPEQGKEGIHLAYAINMAWAALVLSGLWVPIGQVLDIGAPFWCLDAPGEWFRGCFRRAALRAGYVPIAEAKEALVRASKSHKSLPDLMEEGKRSEEQESVIVNVGQKKPRRHAPAPPLSPPAVQPGRREEGNNELGRRRQGSPQPAVEEGTPLLGSQ